MGHNFSFDRWISLNFLQEFPDAIFLEVYVESLLDEAEVSSLQTKIPVRKAHNFWSYRLIVIKFLQEFPDEAFLRVNVESLLSEAEVSSL